MSKPVYLKLGTSLIQTNETAAKSFLKAGYEPATDEEISAAAEKLKEAQRRLAQRQAANQATEKSKDPATLPKIAKPGKKKD